MSSGSKPGRAKLSLYWREPSETEVDVADPVESLVLDLLEWIGPHSRPYAEVLEAWRTSCPRLPVWEAANERGFIDHIHAPGQAALVAVSPLGLAQLQARRAPQAIPQRKTA